MMERVLGRISIEGRKEGGRESRQGISTVEETTSENMEGVFPAA